MRLLVIVALVACGGGSKTAPPPSPSPPTPPPPTTVTQVAAPTRPAPCPTEGDTVPCALATMEYFTNQICSCTDKPCADRVQDEMIKWGTEMAKNARPTREPSNPEVAKRSADIMTRYTECLTKRMMGETQGDMPAPQDPCGGDPCGGP